MPYKSEAEKTAESLGNLFDDYGAMIRHAHDGYSGSERLHSSYNFPTFYRGNARETWTTADLQEALNKRDTRESLMQKGLYNISSLSSRVRVPEGKWGADESSSAIKYSPRIPDKFGSLDYKSIYEESQSPFKWKELSESEKRDAENRIDQKTERSLRLLYEEIGVYINAIALANLGMANGNQDSSLTGRFNQEAFSLIVEGPGIEYLTEGTIKSLQRKILQDDIGIFSPFPDGSQVNQGRNEREITAQFGASKTDVFCCQSADGKYEVHSFFNGSMQQKIDLALSLHNTSTPILIDSNKMGDDENMALKITHQYESLERAEKAARNLVLNMARGHMVGVMAGEVQRLLEEENSIADRSPEKSKPNTPNGNNPELIANDDLIIPTDSSFTPGTSSFNNEPHGDRLTFVQLLNHKIETIAAKAGKEMGRLAAMATIGFPLLDDILTGMASGVEQENIQKRLEGKELSSHGSDNLVIKASRDATAALIADATAGVDIEHRTIPMNAIMAFVSSIFLSIKEMLAAKSPAENGSFVDSVSRSSASRDGDRNPA